MAVTADIANFSMSVLSVWKFDNRGSGHFAGNGNFGKADCRTRHFVMTAEAAIEAAIAGAGLTRAFCYQTVKAENAGLLATVLREYEPDPFPLSLVYASARMLPLKLRAFVDYAVPRLKQRLQQS